MPRAERWQGSVRDLAAMPHSTAASDHLGQHYPASTILPALGLVARLATPQLFDNQLHILKTLTGSEIFDALQVWRQLREQTVRS